MTAAPCPGCDEQPEVREAYVGHQATCPRCLDLSPDSGELSRLAGHGATADEALASWNAAVAEYREMNDG